MSPEVDPVRVALVTGAARGIGAATVAALADRGYAVLALDAVAGPGDAEGLGYPLPGPDDLDAVAAAHEHVEAWRADVRDRAAVAEAVAHAVDRWGRLDVAVAAAAVIAGGRPLWEEESLEALWRTDVVGVWNVAAEAVPRMLAGPDPAGCRFVAVASAAGTRGLYRLAAYTTVKHAVVGLVRGLAADLAGTGVTAVAVAPGATRTPMLTATAALYGVGEDDLAGHQGVGVLEPAEVAATIAHCASLEGRALHGSVVAVDGGFQA